MGVEKYEKVTSISNENITVNLVAKPTSALYSFDETSSSSGNTYPNYPWVYQEIVGKYL
jgi:hypothetical protein